MGTEILNKLRRKKTCLWGVCEQKGADQPAHRHSLISAFSIHLLESIISKRATCEFAIVQLVSVAKETGLCLTLSQIPKTGFVARSPFLIMK